MVHVALSWQHVFLEKIVSKQNPTVFDRHQGLAYLFARKSVNPTVITLYYTYSTFPLNGISYNNYFLPSKTIGADSDYFAYKKLKWVAANDKCCSISIFNISNDSKSFLSECKDMSSHFESIKRTSDILTYTILSLLLLVLILYFIRNICRSPTIADSANADERNIYEMASINDIDIDASNDVDFPSRVILQFRD